MKVLDVAKCFIYLSSIDRKYSLTPLKLQKLLYYAQGFSFVWDDKELFREEFEAWQYGPVNREVYYKYQKYGQNQIPSYEGKELKTPKDKVETIEAVWRDFKRFNAFELVDMTHKEEPWYDVYNRNDIRISNESIKKYFKRVYA